MTDITKLFSLNPLDLEDENIDEIIAEMRKRRNLYNSTPARLSKSSAPTLTDKQQAASKLQIELKL